MGKKPVKYSVVDAFTESPFKGNPAAVCMLEEEREDEWLQSVAAEFNISETCYLIRLDDVSANPRFSLRWFTPVEEIKLCGHATLAASHFLFTSGLVNSDIIEYSTLSGVLTAKRVADAELPAGFQIELDFPVVPLTDYDLGENQLISQALSSAPVIDLKKTTTGEDLFVVLSSAKHVTNLQPQFDDIQKCPGRGLIISAIAPPESDFDFFSRFFCPKLGVKEDPVCGSAHCALVAYWSKKLGKHDFVAYAASPRGGIVNVHLHEKRQRVLLRGKAITVMEGSVLV